MQVPGTWLRMAQIHVTQHRAARSLGGMWKGGCFLTRFVVICGNPFHFALGSPLARFLVHPGQLYLTDFALTVTGRRTLWIA